jgi:hypothetical protein
VTLDCAEAVVAKALRTAKAVMVFNINAVSWFFENAPAPGEAESHGTT